MRLVVFHYHLNRGGVTSVIRAHLASLASSSALQIERVALAYGGRATDWPREFEQELPFPIDHLIVPSLEYDDIAAEGGDLTEDLLTLLDDGGYAQDTTILHIHNHALGKNTALPSTTIDLANEGWRILLQIHDFVEDLRPKNYQHLSSAFVGELELSSALYPQASQIHYAVLNNADHDALATAGVDPQRLELLPNPVACVAASNKESLRTIARSKLESIYAIPSDSRYVLYPVRGIRRKNLGEVLLWSLLLDDCTFSITLEPQNEKERISYQFWQDLSQSLSLPVLFGSGEHLSLEENYAAADAIITTSVAEGFGLVFLEAALRDRPLFGRNLSGVTADFVEHGMQFPGLADELLVPTTAIDAVAFQTVHDRLTQQLREDYDGSSNYAEDKPTAKWPLTENVDFGRLDRQQQSNVISGVMKNSKLKKTIISRNSVVQRARQALLQDDMAAIDASVTNRTVIKKRYSLETIGHQLSNAYRALLQVECGKVELQPDIGRNLLRHFARPEHLSPLRIEP